MRQCSATAAFLHHLTHKISAIGPFCLGSVGHNHSQRNLHLLLNFCYHLSIVIWALLRTWDMCPFLEDMGHVSLPVKFCGRTLVRLHAVVME